MHNVQKLEAEVLNLYTILIVFDTPHSVHTTITMCVLSMQQYAL